MKKVFLAAVIFLAATSKTLYAQDDEIQTLQKEWGQEKKELVRMGMALTAADSVKFWPVYQKYEKERQKLGKERILIIQDYADHFLDLTNAKADELVNRIFKNEAALTTLQKTYYTTVKSKLNAKQAAKFLQIETYINSFLKSAIQEEIPVIGELDELKKSL